MTESHSLGELDPNEIEASHSTSPHGPSSRAICRVTVSGTCGSGTLVGRRGGKSLILTNAHVAGTRVGRACNCFFPDLQQTHQARIIMAAYSDRIMMDWAVLEADMVVDLPHTKLMNKQPSGVHYTGGYPRCKGPYYQKLRTQGFTYNGTVWKWQPNAIGGQSGSGVHSCDDNLLYGLLTWSWGGDGAGQTVKSIWHQYVNRAAIGFPRPDGLVELSNRAEGLEEGFFQQSNITTLPIWAHLDEDDEEDEDDGEDDKPIKPNPKLAEAVLKQVAETQQELGKLAELARKYQGGGGDEGGGDKPDADGPLFGL